MNDVFETELLVYVFVMCGLKLELLLFVKGCSYAYCETGKRVGRGN